MTLSFPLELRAIERAAREVVFRTQAFIADRFCDAASGETYASINPATGRLLGKISSCDAHDVDVAVGAARRAFQKGTWAQCPAAQRKCIMMKLADLIEKNLAELAAEAGVPEGVINVVPGDGSVVGAALCKHMDVDAVAFTGSTEVGRRLLEDSAQSNLKRIVLELGGQEPSSGPGECRRS